MSQDQPTEATTVDTLSGALEFLRAFEVAAGGTDIEFRLLTTEAHVMMIGVGIGPRLFAFTKPQAETMIAIIAKAIEKFGDPGSLADLIFSLRRSIGHLDQAAQPPAPMLRA